MSARNTDHETTIYYNHGRLCARHAAIRKRIDDERALEYVADLKRHASRAIFALQLAGQIIGHLEDGDMEGRMEARDKKALLAEAMAPERMGGII